MKDNRKNLSALREKWQIIFHAKRSLFDKADNNFPFSC